MREKCHVATDRLIAIRTFARRAEARLVRRLLRSTGISLWMSIEHADRLAFVVERYRSAVARRYRGASPEVETIATVPELSELSRRLATP